MQIFKAEYEKDLHKTLQLLICLSSHTTHLIYQLNLVSKLK